MFTFPFEKLNSYLNGAVDEPSKGAQDSFNDLIENFLHLATQGTSPEKLQIIQEVNKIFQLEKRKKNNDVAKQRILEFKKVLLNKINEQSLQQYRNWKDALCGAHYQTMTRSYMTKVTPNVDADVDIDKDDPNRFVRNSNYNSSLLSGSTFATNNQARIDAESNVEKPILDASYSAVTSDGVIIAIADGLGGHFGDDIQDTAIGRTSYFAAKHATRLMATYDDADSLGKSLATGELIQQIAAEVDTKTKNSKQRTALACGRAFKTEQGFRFVGFNVGDTMLIAYNPQLQQYFTLSYARELIQPKMGGGGPAGIPNGIKNENDIHLIDTVLPEGTLIMGVTDGVYDELPVTTTQVPIKDSDNYYRDTIIDFNALFNHPLFERPTISTPEAFVKSITDFAIMHVELKLQEKVAAALEAKPNFDTVDGVEKQAIVDSETVLQQKGTSATKGEQEAFEEQKQEWQRKYYALKDKITVKEGDDFTANCVILTDPSHLLKQCANIIQGYIDRNRESDLFHSRQARAEHIVDFLNAANDSYEDVNRKGISEELMRNTIAKLFLHYQSIEDSFSTLSQKIEECLLKLLNIYYKNDKPVDNAFKEALDSRYGFFNCVSTFFFKGRNAFKPLHDKERDSIYLLIKETIDQDPGIMNSIDHCDDVARQLDLYDEKETSFFNHDTIEEDDFTNVFSIQQRKVVQIN